MCVLVTDGCSDTDVVAVMLLIARGKYPVVKSRKILTSCIHASVRQLRQTSRIALAGQGDHGC